ncbi:hypothetical protein SAMN06264364_1423 [Quadrisphaera granulorum]|uniref:Uncharacterized protein n=1 Tax=Quadrisphaera granulorum TaxID=317664 RepID=A0A315ZN95_9ACTN|nr:hypothetical protein [Quadrisphaera granulorum]PWJ47041.1 hypothetical protein BXY45_1423 [Quadrisphaera granulorum]SZE98942.1 hypothetical protein SAMN06264364_1423 [Quadrisphaera granulorum]
MPTPPTPRRPGRALLVVTAALLGAAGLSLWAALPPSPPPAAAELPQCPAVTVGQGEPSPTASSCLFSDAAEEEGAELVVTAPTTEGDPIRTHYRRLPGQPGLEVLVDSTNDRFGSGTWTRQSCPEAMSLSDLGTCTDSP